LIERQTSSGQRVAPGDESLGRGQRVVCVGF